MKLLSTEIGQDWIQTTYTDGPAADNAKELLVLRQPFDGDVSKSIRWHHMQLMLQLSEWASAEFRRLRDEAERV